MFLEYETQFIIIKIRLVQQKKFISYEEVPCYKQLRGERLNLQPLEIKYALVHVLDFKIIKITFDIFRITQKHIIEHSKLI